MYAPRFTISHKMLYAVGSIEAARDVIEHTELSPDVEKQLQSDAILRTIYHGTHIEGNDLTQSQTKQILEGATSIAQNRDVQEVINYRRAVNLIEELSQKTDEYSLDWLRDIHAAMVYNIVPVDKAGFFRTTQVVIREEETGAVIFTPPPAFQVPSLLGEFFTWLNSSDARQIHPVIRAAIAHYILVSIHSFVEGNGSTTRAFTNLIIIREGYDQKRLFALDETLDSDLDAYYEAFFQVDSQSPDISERDLTVWIEYFCGAVATEMTKAKDIVRERAIDTRAKLHVADQVALSARQMKLIEYLSDNGRAQMRELKQVLPMVSDDTILRDLTALTKKGIIEKEGTTKASSYILKT